ncbi:site-specific integrase, partial [Vibrio parahaemolyticus]|nr:site-specific integrase [Vibrio parahaemolyticus]
NWSTGAHGLRHSYAQERMSELQKNMTYEKALEVVSQEMGHFRPDITEVYLR